MARFYVDLPLCVGSEYQLPENVIRHLNVVRTRLSDQITLFNGDGFDYSASLLSLTKREAQVKLHASKLVSNEARLKINLLLSIIASDKFDLVLQKAVELGVRRITPVYSQNTQRFNSTKLQTRIRHWQNIILAASEQSGRATLTILEQPQELASALPLAAGSLKLIFSPSHANSTPLITDSIDEVSLLIGPEGGFSAAEVELAIEHGFLPRLLGARILRAETAAIAAISFIHSVAGDF